MNHWGASSVVFLFAVLAFAAGLVIALSVLTKSDDKVEEDRANTTRATLLLLISFTIAIFVLATQRMELADSISKLM